MKLVQSIRVGGWILIILNLLMAFGSIWVFMRMAPVIDNIIKQNASTLVACERMLANVALLTGDEEEDKPYKARFIDALDQAKGTITEKGEPEAIENIDKHYRNAFKGDNAAVKKTVIAIMDLSRINKLAMTIEDVKARKFGTAGAWGVVFMATAVFTVAMLLVRGVRRNLIYPIEEIYAVIEANVRGESMRRCSGARVSQDLKVLYNGINEMLDLSGDKLDEDRFK